MAITKMMCIKQSKGSNPSSGLKKALKYIVNPEKTDGGRLVAGYNCNPDWKLAYTDMVTTKLLKEKLDGRQGYHFVLSFSPTETVTPELVMTITKEFIDEYLGNGYEALYSVHTDQKHLHSHIIFNSISRDDGYKYRYENGDWAVKVQPITNKICKKYGLQEIDLSQRIFNKDMDSTLLGNMLERGKRLHHGEWEEQRKGITWAQFAAADIDAVLENSNTFEDLVRELQDIGWEVKWKTKDGQGDLKHWAVRPPKEAGDKDGNRKWIRPGTKCGYGYSREGIEERIKWDLVHTDGAEVAEAFKREQTPRIVGCRFPGGDFKVQLTRYQKKYFARLYRMGIMEKRGLARITMEKRVGMKQLRNVEKKIILSCKNENYNHYNFKIDC